MSGRDELVERIARAIIIGSGGERAADHAQEFDTANWADAKLSAREVIPIIDAEIAAGERDMKNRAIQCCATANGQDNIDNGAAMTGAAGMARQLIERLTIRSQP